ncbi:Programmed cell death 6-interacting protein [Echinococcus granulosus]|uniref:Programmed cell death 6 interacting protein n=1 Tax=Echinococcus granulosus TaxID=6210 RepID=A0A068WC28_ECHGR|nr:Programmed cell death 6-interacting protein [Echinococcus granulosus]CDS17241.1 programmed cell death 6 interacting protein [Echinococcus granulosus]
MVFVGVPCKKGADVDLVKPIEHYIKGNLGSGQASACKKGLEHLQKLRNDILVKLDDAHDSTVRLIESYCDLLESLEQRIPLTNQDIPIAYKWYDCFSGSSKVFRSSMKGYNAGFDRCCMLFNLAACHSQIAKNQNTNDDCGLKIAAKSFQIAAGMFDYVKILLPTFYAQSPTWDMSAEALAGYSSIMLAQAQECIFIKAEHDDMKPTVVSKLANQASLLYNEALTAVSLASLRPYLPKEWSILLSNKAAMMEVYAEYYAAFAAEAEQSFGEQISRLNKTLALLKKISRSEGMKDFYAKVERTRDRAKKDNDLIYHEIIPDPKTLPSIGVASVAKKIPVTFPLAGKPPKELFTTLVPIPVYNATQVADGVCRQMISVEVGRLREATDTCNGVMASLNLPAAVQEIDGSEDAVFNPLFEKAAIIRQNGGVAALREKISSLADGNTRNAEIVEDIFSTIEEEEKTDNELREQFGDKWNRQQSSKLNSGWRAEIAKHRQLLQQAGQTDKGLKERFSVQEASFDHFSGSESELREYITSEMEKQGSSTVLGGSSSKKKALCALCNQVDTMKKERVDLQKQLEQIKLPESLTKEFLKIYQKGGTIDAQSLATEHVNKALESARDCIRESLDKQTSMLKDIQSLYESIFGKKKEVASALTTLLMAAEAYDQLCQDVGQGITFYADLTGILIKFQNKVNDYVFARRTEKKELMKDISKEMSSERPCGAPERPPPTYKSAPETATGQPNSSASAPPPAQSFPPGGAPAPGYWPGYGTYPTPLPQGFMPPGTPNMPMYGMYGGYPMPMYPMPGLPSQTQQPPQ